jgi:hypothetical protein
MQVRVKQALPPLLSASGAFARPPLLFPGHLIGTYFRAFVAERLRSRQMANPMDQDKEANPIAEIFDEMFTLLADIETRNAALFEYMKEQGGVTDEKLAPYLDRAAAASDVRWRAARARMEHLLAPKPKSAIEVGKDEKTKEPSSSQPQAKGKEAESSGTKPQGEKKQEPKADSKDLGKELALAQPGDQTPSESRDAGSQIEKPAAESKPKEAEQGSKNGDRKQTSGKSSSSSDAEEQASALADGKKQEPNKTQSAKTQTPPSDAGNSSSQSSGDEKQQTHKAAK